MASLGDEEEGDGVNDVGRPSLTRVSSPSSVAERCSNVLMSISKINALSQAVNRHCDEVSRMLLSSKEPLDKRTQIMSAFRVCKEAFQEVSTVLAHFLDDKPDHHYRPESIKKAVLDAIRESPLIIAAPSGGNVDASLDAGALKRHSYASIVTGGSKVHVPGGPTVVATASTSFLIVPDNEKGKNLTSSAATKEALNKVFKPADCALKINRIIPTKGNGIKIEAYSPDIERIKAHPGLMKMGLKVTENTKLNPRIIVYGVPACMSSEEIRDELIAQNLNGKHNTEVKVIYKYPTKNKTWTSCVLEVSPAIRKLFQANGRIFLRYAACRFADHVLILQCYKCFAFGHIATNCTSSARCGHCAGEHEIKNCSQRNEPPRCCNCIQNKALSTDDVEHSAKDAKKCPILCKRIKERIININYG